MNTRTEEKKQEIFIKDTNKDYNVRMTPMAEYLKFNHKENKRCG